MKTHSNEQRLADRNAAAPVWQALLDLQKAANKSGLESALLELAKIRASQINRCAFCLDLHTRVAKSRNEKPERLYLLEAWEEVDVYSPREKAALRWTECLTRLPDGVPDAVYAEVRRHLSEAELVELTLAIIAINGWNRLNVAFRIPPDFNYLPAVEK